MAIERELKFRLAPQAAARATSLLPLASRVRRRRVESVYYDTPDLRLHAAGAALRLRRDARQWLQALKAPQAADGAFARRSEWEMPAPGARLDCRRFPIEEVRAATGIDLLRLAAKLRPVFATRFERRSALLALGHGVRAEACLDAGAVESGGAREPILELELELLEGTPGPLLGLAEKLVEPLGLTIEVESKAQRGYRLYRSAGEPPPAKWERPAIADRAAASDALVALAGAALTQVAVNAPGVARGGDAEYLHQLRVGVRRLRSALRAFRPLLKRARARRAERPFKKMMRTFGTARDWDVFCEMLGAGGATSALLQLARRRRGRARRAARSLSGSAGFQRAQLAALRWLHGDPWRSDAARAQPLSAFARGALARQHERVLERARKIDWDDAQRRHAVRIAVKRLRYACDFFAHCFPRQAVLPLAHALAALQDTLGELNDVTVAHRLLDEIAPARGALELRQPAGTMRHWLRRRSRELIASLERNWSAFERKRPYWEHGRAHRGAR